MSNAEISDYLEKINASVTDLATDDVGDITNFGETVIMPRVPEFEIQFFNDDPENLGGAELINSTGSASSTTTEGKGVFSSGTDPTAQYTLQSRQVINSAAAREQYLTQNIAWTQPPTNENDKAEIGFFDQQTLDGFTWGYNGTTWGITHYRNGNEIEFIPREEFNKDTLAGNEGSEFTSDDAPVGIDLTTLNTFRILFSNTTPTRFQVLAPDGNWITAHKLPINTSRNIQLINPNLPGSINIEKNGSDDTDITIETSYWNGGNAVNSKVNQQPDGDFVTDTADGEAFRSTELLGANETFTSEWIDTDGWGTIEFQLVSDQPSADDGLEIQFTSNVQTTTPSVDANRTFTYRQAEIDADTSIRIIIPTQMDGFRMQYTNGNTGQNTFLAIATLRVDFRPEISSLEAPIGGETLTQTVRNIIHARNDSDEYGEIRRDSNALKTSVSNFNIDVPVRAHSSWRSEQIQIDNTSPTQVDTNSLTDRKILEFTNEGPNDANVYIGPTDSVTENNGYPLAQGEHKELELTEDAELWAILDSSVTGNTQVQTLSANNTLVNNGVTNPDNVFSSDDSDAIFDTQGDNAEWGMEDFNFSTGFSVISDVVIGFEGDEGGTGFQTITHEQTETEIQLSGTSITTSQNLIANSEHFYLAFISVRDDTITVDSVSGLGLTWSQETTVVNINGIRTDVWTASGTPNNDTPVTANFSNEITSGAIAASRWSGVDIDGTSVNATDIDTDSTATWNVQPAGTQSGDRIIGASAIRRTTTNDPGGDDTEHSDESVNNHTMATQSREATSPDEPTDGTWGQAGDWAAVAIALNQNEQPPPEVTLEYEVSNEGTGATNLTQTLDNTTDQDFTQEVTGDRSWTQTDINNTTLTMTLNNTDARDANIDHIFMEITEAESTATQTCAILEEAE